jgi:hypothetical protein
MSDPGPEDIDDVPDRGGRKASDGLEERGQGAGRLLGEGAEQAIAADEVDSDQDAEQTADEDS